MKKYSIEAEDLLSEFELFEIKGGGEPDTGDSDDSGEEGDCLICSTCVACQTCKVCQSEMMDVIVIPL